MKTKIITILLLVLAVVAVEGLKTANKPKAKEAPEVSKVRPRLLDLGADKCIPCKTMAPILDEMAETFKETLQVEFIDVWKNPDTAEPYNIRIIPTQIFFDAEGKELFRHEGFFSRADMLAQWQELGFDFSDPIKD